MKILFILNLITLFFGDNVHSAGHDFTNEVWAKGKSCLVCHSLKNDLPKVSPPGSRIVDLLKLEPEEQTAYESNSNNITCLVCHQAKHSVIAPKTNTIPVGTLPSPQFPGGISSGSEGSINIRVTNRGANSFDCLKCHDLHNENSQKMLKADYWQN